jgi:F-type H+-transporting ATPase subunit epsilon
MHCIVRSADRAIYDGDVHHVVARSPHGEFAVMDKHAPLLAVLVPGLVRLHAQDGETHIACSGGTFDFADNCATLLVERPVLLSEIDPAALRDRLHALRSESSAEMNAPDEVAYLEMLIRLKEDHG